MADENDSCRAAERERELWIWLKRHAQGLGECAGSCLNPRHGNLGTECITRMIKRVLPGVRSGKIEISEKVLFAELRCECLGVLFQILYPQLLRRAYRHLQHHDADECISQMYTKLLRQVRDGKIEPGEGIFFHQLSYQCLMAWRSSDRRTKHEGGYRPLGRPPEPPDQIVERRERRERIPIVLPIVHSIARTALQGCCGEPTATLVVARLGFFSGKPMSYEEILTQYGPQLKKDKLTTIGAIKSRVSRCRQEFLRLFVAELDRRDLLDEAHLVFVADPKNDAT